MTESAGTSGVPQRLLSRDSLIRLSGSLLVAVAGAMAATWYVTRSINVDRGLISGGRPLEIKDLIEQVRSELVATEVAMRKRNELPLFKLKDFEMEINYVIRSGSVVKTEVVGVGTDLSLDKERVQKLTLRWAACPTRIAGTFRAASAPLLPDASVVIGPSVPVLVPAATPNAARAAAHRASPSEEKSDDCK